MVIVSNIVKAILHDTGKNEHFSLIVVTNHMICESDAIYAYLFFNSRDFSTIIIATHV
jgi:hypothetical protein